MPLSIDTASYTYSPGTSYAQPALRDVSVSVSAGEVVLVLGATGSGKSTLLRVAAGLVSPQSGTAAIDGAPLTPASARGLVGLVFQNPESQLFAETVLTDVEFGPRNLGATDDEARRRAFEALAEVALDPEAFADRSPFSLSGGEARRAAIAGVLAMQPRYLLLDEPTAGLDARGRGAVFAVLSRVRTSVGAMVVSHDPEEFLAIADRVLVLASGATAFCGTPAELLADPAPLLRAGVGLPPLVEVQLLAREAGCRLSELAATPEGAAEAIAASWRGRG